MAAIKLEGIVDLLPLKRHLEACPKHKREEELRQFLKHVEDVAHGVGPYTNWRWCFYDWSTDWPIFGPG